MTDEIDDRPDSIYYRKAAVVITALDIVSSDPRPTGIPWLELLIRVSELHPKTTHKTIENTIHDLIKFGGAHKTGSYTRGQDTRKVRATGLGVAWLEQTLMPLPGADKDDDGGQDLD